MKNTIEISIIERQKSFIAQNDVISYILIGQSYFLSSGTFINEKYIFARHCTVKIHSAIFQKF